jgi:hypothetical protein
MSLKDIESTYSETVQGEWFARIELLLSWVRTHSQDAIFALQPHLNMRWEVFRDESRHADSQVHVETILEFLCGTPRDPVTDILGGKSISSWTIRRRLSKGLNFNLLPCGSLHDAIDIDARYMDGIRGD